jgi:uncharacterized membrane protein
MSNYTLAADIIILTILILVIDCSYLYGIRNIFSKQIMDVQNSPLKMDFLAAVLCYVLIVFGLYYFIIREKKSVFEAFMLGVVIYGIYELTTKALITNWRWQTVMLDSVWGGILFAIATAIFYQYKK